VTSGGPKSLKPDLAVALATAQAIVDRLLPGQRVAMVHRLHGGEISAVYEIGFTAAQPPLVLKVYPVAFPWKMRKEVTVSTLLRDRLRAPTPRILLADDSKSLLALNFVVMEKLEGENLLGLEKDLTDDQISYAYRRMGEVLRELHQISMEAFGYIGPQGVWTAHSNNHAYVTSQFDRKLKEFIDRGGDPALARRVARFVSEREHLLHACTAPVLCHNDYHARNVLVVRSNSDLRLTGVLDFENAHAADPLMDLAKTLYCAPEVDDAKRAALLNGYGPFERTHWIETVELYHLYYILEFWCWMTLLGNLDPLPGLAEDMERYMIE